MFRSVFGQKAFARGRDKSVSDITENLRRAAGYGVQDDTNP